MARIIPLSGGDISRQALAAAGKIKANELHTTTQRRGFIENVLIGPVWHGTVATEAAMVALDAGPRGCFPGDFCARSDTGVLMLCTTGRGKLAGDWVAVGGGSVPPPASSLDIRDVWLFN